MTKVKKDSSSGDHKITREGFIEINQFPRHVIMVKRVGQRENLNPMVEVDKKYITSLTLTTMNTVSILSSVSVGQ